MNYGAMVYKKTAAVMGFMKQYLGEEEFDEAMLTYFQIGSLSTSLATFKLVWRSLAERI